MQNQVRLLIKVIVEDTYFVDILYNIYTKVDTIYLSKLNSPNFNISKLEKKLEKRFNYYFDLTVGLKKFFTDNPLSQSMDDTNPLSELTHKRRLSSFGVGGLKKENVKLDIREIHPSHFGRVCPIETSEGKNAGLVLSLAKDVRLNNFGFIESPFYF